MKIGIASDHAGYNLKEQLKIYLLKQNYEILDFGTNNKNSVNYPKYAFLLSEKVISKEINLGIIICKTGIGMSIACNKIKGIRCAKVCTLKEAYYSKKHNNANVLAISGMMSFIKAKRIIKKFIETEVSLEKRHKTRLNMIKEYEDEL